MLILVIFSYLYSYTKILFKIKRKNYHIRLTRHKCYSIARKLRKRYSIFFMINKNIESLRLLIFNDSVFEMKEQAG